MSRRSPFVIELTNEEQAELEARSNENTSPFSEVMRAKIVLLASQGLDNDRIAARLGMPRQIVSQPRGACGDCPSKRSRLGRCPPGIR